MVQKHDLLLFESASKYTWQEEAIQKRYEPKYFDYIDNVCRKKVNKN